MKVLSLWDIHYPYNIDLDPILEFAKDFKPDVIQFVGDCLDLAYLSHWNELSPGKWGDHRLAQDLEDMGNIIDLFLDLKPKEFNYFIGNHEFWLKQFSDKFPFLRSSDTMGLLDLNIGLKSKEKGIRIVPYNKSTRYGKLNYIHGVYVNSHHADKTLSAYQVNIRYGHTHDVKVTSLSSTLDSHVKNAMSCGCLCNRNPEYLHGKPNKWSHAFHIAYIMPDGNFTDYIIPIVKNKFIFADKIYK